MGLKTSDFLAAGDSVNDVSMLKLAGFSVVPSNGTEDAKAVGSVVLDEPYGDAVAKALAKYF